MSKVVCLNGHDVTGVDGFTCPSCHAEVRTLLTSPRRGPGPLRLMLLGAVLLSLVIGMIASEPAGVAPLTAAMLFSMGATGSALWLAGCLRIAVAIVRDA